MKTPTLEEVKKRYFDAKQVRCTESNRKVFEIDINTIRKLKGYNQIVCDSKNNDTCYVSLWNKGKYAKIISYKSTSNIDLSKLTPELITELCKEPNIKEFMINNGVVKNELELNRWYKSKSHKEILIYPTSIKLSTNTFFGFGFGTDGKFRHYEDNNSNYCLCNSFASEYLYLATPKEVETALKNEAVKKYKVGDKIKAIDGFYYGNSKMIIDNLDFKYQYRDNILYIKDEKGYNICVFYNGTWATIIPQPKLAINPLDFKDLNDAERLDLIKAILENY